MSAQDQTEKVLRKLHILLSKSEPYERNPKKVIIDKDEMLGILSELNTCIYGIMDEYELTQRSRDKAEREFRKQGDQIVWNASRKAEDIYAASVMYTDEALNRVYEIMNNASESIRDIYADIDKKLKAQEKDLKKNQIELKSQLQGLVDTEKYLTLIEQRNREIKKQEEEGKKKGKNAFTSEKNIYADRQTGIKINTEYLEKMGYSVGGAEEEEEEDTNVQTNAQTKVEEKKSAIEAYSKKDKDEEKDADKDAKVVDDDIDVDTEIEADEDSDIEKNEDFLAFQSAIKGDDEDDNAVSEEEARMRAELDADYFDWVENEAEPAPAEEKEDTDELTGNIQNVLKKLREKKLL